MNEETDEPFEHIPADMIGDVPHSKRRQKPRKNFSGINRIEYLFLFVIIFFFYQFSGEGIIAHFLLALVAGFRCVNAGKSFAWSLVAMIPIVSLIVYIPCFYLKPGHFSEKKGRDPAN